MGPLDGQRGRHVPDGGFGTVVGSDIQRVSMQAGGGVPSELCGWRAYAWGWGTLTMEPLMLPMKTMLPVALRSIKCLATVMAKR